MIKQYLAKICPVTVSIYSKGISRLKKQQAKDTQSILEAVTQNNPTELLQSMAQDQLNYQAAINNELLALHTSIEALDKKVSALSTTPASIQQVKEELKVVERNINNTQRSSDEVLWGMIFNNTITNSTWLIDRTFSPGRWAVGYQYLYVLYRTLNEIHPTSILELGLGQSTKMITQYAHSNSACSHIVTEHNKEWIEFYQNANFVSNNTQIQTFELGKEPYLDDPGVTCYLDFETPLKGKTFDLISIDAPFGHPCNKYARVDVLKLLPGCLSQRFVILIDDYNRPGEVKMVELLKQILEDNNIAYSAGQYKGAKYTCIITSTDLSFLCSM